MGEHLIDGEFQSDKYPWCQRGFVPLKLTDPMAQPVLWEYAQARRAVDADFADDLEEALRLKMRRPDQVETIGGYLDAIEIPYQIDHRLVRGLDYYTRTVFEVQPMEGGAQSTIVGGGRYDGLIQGLGGRPTPGIGFATGMERMALNLKRSGVEVPEEPAPKYLVANVGEGARPAALELAAQLRSAGVGAILSSGSRALRGQMRQANALGIPYALILGDDEIQRGEVVVRDMQASTQETKPLQEFLDGAATGKT